MMLMMMVKGLDLERDLALQTLSRSTPRQVAVQRAGSRGEVRPRTKQNLADDGSGWKDEMNKSPIPPQKCVYRRVDEALGNHATPTTNLAPKYP